MKKRRGDRSEVSGPPRGRKPVPGRAALPKAPRSGLPSRDELLSFIHASTTPVGKRDIARAFQVKGAARTELRAMMKALERDGLLERGHGRRMAPPGALPETLVVEIVGPDVDGELIARPFNWQGQDSGAAPPVIFVIEEQAGPARPALAAGDRALVRLTRLASGEYEARPLRRLVAEADRIIGVYYAGPDSGRIVPTDRRQKSELVVLRGDERDAQPEEVVLAELVPGNRFGLPRARVLERLGSLAEPKAFSLIAIHTHDIPHRFPDAALQQAASAGPATQGDDLKGRTDLRDVPLVTIDGADARDFDDAVWAEPDDDPANPGGWKLLVAIADVAWYVRPGDALDLAAYERGNSVYFPDRVVPMLPEPLSNGWCSLKPEEERGCLVAAMTIDADGRKLAHRFLRGLMRSAARLTYEQVQAARDGTPDDATRPLLGSVIAPLYGAYDALAKARRQRGALDIDLPERKVVLDEKGRVERVGLRTRLDSHKLIEEFMILANVAAAEALEQARSVCMYRVHDAPDPVRVRALAEFLETLDIAFDKGAAPKPKRFNQLLERVAGSPHAQLVNELVLRSQSQAVYSPENIGHFGLALRRYAHFTSPIRRYADLLVHRALVAALKLGEGGLPDMPQGRGGRAVRPEASGLDFAAMAAHISATERRSDMAEREVTARYAAAFMAERVGSRFQARISGVTRFGLFVQLKETGTDGLIPIATLPADYYDHDEARHCLVGRRHGRRYRLAQPVAVTLVEVEPVAGRMVFALADDAADESSGDRDREGGGPRFGRSGRNGKPGSSAGAGKARTQAGLSRKGRPTHDPGVPEPRRPGGKAAKKPRRR